LEKNINVKAFGCEGYTLEGIGPPHNENPHPKKDPQTNVSGDPEAVYRKTQGPINEHILGQASKVGVSSNHREKAYNEEIKRKKGGYSLNLQSKHETIKEIYGISVGPLRGRGISQEMLEKWIKCLEPRVAIKGEGWDVQFSKKLHARNAQPSAGISRNLIGRAIHSPS